MIGTYHFPQIHVVYFSVNYSLSGGRRERCTAFSVSVSSMLSNALKTYFPSVVLLAVMTFCFTDHLHRNSQQVCKKNNGQEGSTLLVGQCGYHTESDWKKENL